MSRRRGFTLVEAVVSLFISTVVIGGVVVVGSQLAMTWRDSVANWMLAHHGRLAREMILRGVEGQFGLREGSIGSVVVQSGAGPRINQLLFNDVGTACRIETTAGQTPGTRVLAGGALGSSQELIAGDVNTEVLEFRRVGREVRVLLRLVMDLGGKHYVREQEIVCYMLND